MKNLLLPWIIILLFTLQMRAQNYVPFPTANASWIDSQQCQENHYRITGDTIVNNNTYHKVEKTYRYYQMDQWGDCDYYRYRSQTYPIQYFGCFRNDSAAKRIYFIPKDSTNEKLLYDFNYSLGDTLRPTDLRSYNFNYPNPLVVTEVDSILISGRYHRTIGFISCPNSYFGTSDTLLLIEGVGSNSGLLSSYDICNYYVRPSMLYCHRQNGQVIYFNRFGTCQLLTSINNRTQQEAKVSISPNPAKEVIHIATDHTVESTVIINAQGQIIKEVRNGRKEINISEIPTGVYFAKIQLKSGEIIWKKLVKE